MYKFISLFHIIDVIHIIVNESIAIVNLPKLYAYSDEIRVQNQFKVLRVVDVYHTAQKLHSTYTALSSP